MRQFGKRVAVVATAGLLAMTGVTGCGSMNNNAVVAVVGDENITMGVANFYVRMQQAQYETYYAAMMGMTGEEMWKQEFEAGKTYESSTKASLLESLENLFLISQHAADYNISLSANDHKAIEKAAEEFIGNNTTEDLEVISGQEKNVKKFLELSTIAFRMDAEMRKGVDEEVSDDEARQKSMQYVFFSYVKTAADGSSELMTDEEQAALKAQVQEFLDKVNASDNKDMAAPAAELGIEVQTATFDAQSTSPDAGLIAAADAVAAEGELTGLVETANGIYIGKVTSLLDREATDSKKTQIINERKQAQYDSLLKQWREETTITQKTRVWNKISLINQGVTIYVPEETNTENTTEETNDTANDTTEQK